MSGGAHRGRGSDSNVATDARAGRRRWRPRSIGAPFERMSERCALLDWPPEKRVAIEPNQRLLKQLCCCSVHSSHSPRRHHQRRFTGHEESSQQSERVFIFIQLRERDEQQIARESKDRDWGCIHSMAPLVLFTAKCRNCNLRPDTYKSRRVRKSRLRIGRGYFSISRSAHRISCASTGPPGSAPKSTMKSGLMARPPETTSTSICSKTDPFLDAIKK